MSTQSKLASALSAKAHNVLFAIQGLIFAIAALHSDLPNIMSSIQSWIPMITGIAHLIYHEKQVASAAFSAGDSANVTQTAGQLATVLANASSDINTIKTTAQAVVAAVNTANS